VRRGAAQRIDKEALRLSCVPGRPVAFATALTPSGVVGSMHALSAGRQRHVSEFRTSEKPSRSDAFTVPG
jgi:hypothetical protein